MNYYPYYPVIPTRPSLFGIFRNFNFGSILSGTQKVLNIANQTIPLIKQVSPVFKNAKTMFKVVNEIRKPDPINYENKKKSNETKVNKEVSNVENIKNESINGPIFFV